MSYTIVPEIQRTKLAKMRYPNPTHAMVTFTFSFLASSLALASPTSLASFSRSETRLAAMDSDSRRFFQTPLARSEAIEDERPLAITLQEWQGWGTHSALPRAVAKIVEELRVLESDIDAEMRFGGKGGKLQGDFGILEDKKHRAMYEGLDGSEQKLQFFSARQIACRLLGSRGYLCQKCWLPHEDCMCSSITACKLWQGIRFWVYMHPKDFLRQNNTGKLLWQLLGVEAANLCLFGIAEHEEMMWNMFKRAGKEKVWCLYPSKNDEVHSVQGALGQESSSDSNFKETMDGDEALNFILIDGTWNNSAAMFRRLKDQAKSVWGVEEMPCISLLTGASAMHKLRPQPSWDRTCTAAAGIGLLTELQNLPNYSSHGLGESAEAIEGALVILLDALTTRRLRMGRSITRKMRHHRDIV